MDSDEIQCKFPRITDGNGRLDPIKMGQPPDEDGGETKRGAANGGVRGGGMDLGGGLGRFYGFPSSRIVRVSRASGGKDRHSKVLTSRGLRDRRVRLSVNTAIQFYDLQDRLGYDQPSKAVEWLLKAAASSIAELPPMATPFPDTPKQLSDGKRPSTDHHYQLGGFGSAEVDMDGGGGDPNYQHHQQQQQQQQHVTKSSACSSPSETSKGSGGLSLSRSESRIKARERAKGRVAEKEKEKDDSPHVASYSQTTSFTELLSAGISNLNNNGPNAASGPVPQDSNNNDGGGGNESIFFQKSPRQWSSTMDYLTSGLLGPPVITRQGQMQLASPLFTVAGDHQPELQHFSFVPDNLVPVVNAASGASSSCSNGGGGGEYNLNFTISSSANNASVLSAGCFNRGTLQSNSSSPSLLPHLQRFVPVDGPHQSFFIGTAAPVENHQTFLSQYFNSSRHSGQKGKGKN